MQPDVLTMHRFYQTSLGIAAAGLISERIAYHLPPLAGSITVGLGYALPYMETLLLREPEASCARFLAFMPARQGVFHWPSITANRTALVDPYHLPLDDSSVERLLLAHSLEHANRPSALLREVWRVLAPGGQVVVLVPNRLRTWSAAEATPFGHGRPYTKGQLFSLMEEHMLSPDAFESVLMQPPFRWQAAAKLMRVSEKVIGAMGSTLGGALLVSARKQVYGALPKQASKAGAIPVLTRLP